MRCPICDRVLMPEALVCDRCKADLGEVLSRRSQAQSRLEQGRQAEGLRDLPRAIDLYRQALELDPQSPAVDALSRLLRDDPPRPRRGLIIALLLLILVFGGMSIMQYLQPTSAPESQVSGWERVGETLDWIAQEDWAQLPAQAQEVHALRASLESGPLRALEGGLSQLAGGWLAGGLTEFRSWDWLVQTYRIQPLRSPWTGPEEERIRGMLMAGQLWGGGGSQSHMFLGLLAESRGDLDAASHWYQRVLESKGAYQVDAAFRWAVLQELQGDQDGAYQTYQTVLEMSGAPWYWDDALYRQAEIHRRRGEITEYWEILQRLAQDYPQTHMGRVAIELLNL